MNIKTCSTLEVIITIYKRRTSVCPYDDFCCCKITIPVRNSRLYWTTQTQQLNIYTNM